MTNANRSCRQFSYPRTVALTASSSPTTVKELPVTCNSIHRYRRIPADYLNSLVNFSAEGDHS